MIRLKIITAIIAIGCCCYSFSFIQAAPLEPGQLSCAYIQNPLGIDAAQPAFAWTFIASQRNQVQSAYELLVSDNEEDMLQLKGNVWATGKISSSQNIQIIYEGPSLRSFTKYFWRVKVYNQQGEASSWSKPAWFETAMMAGTDWKAVWISDGSKPPVRAADYYQPDQMPLFRRSFFVSKKIISARLYISGLGYYEAFLNGKKVGDRVLDPGFTSYRKEVQYAVYDITPLTRRGKNCAGIMLGNGWYNPLPLRLFGHWDLRDYLETGRPSVKAEIHINFTDGSVQLIKTDENWETAPGPIIKNNVYLGESYDARLEQRDWCLPNAQKATWKNAVPVQGPRGLLTAEIQPPIRITQILKPVRMEEPKPDTFIVDMGQNFAGVAAIKLKGPAGTKISLRYGEEVFKDGTLDFLTSATTQIKKGGANGGPGAPETAWQEDTYILKGQGIETWSPRFTFHGFRYVEITGWPGKPTLDDIVGYRMNADLQVVGSFECDNAMFNRLHKAIQWTFLSNVFSVQSDCPAREKMGYGGDMVATSNAFLYNYDMANFYKKAIRDFANDQQPAGGITEIAPFTGIADKGYGGNSGPMGWELAFPYLQERLYDYYGDRTVISENYAAFQKQIDFLQSKSVDNLFYWDISDHEALNTKPEAFTASAFYYHHVLLMARFAGILGKREDSIHYSTLASQIKEAIIEKYWVKNTGRFDNGTQTAQVFALWYHFSPVPKASMQALMDELTAAGGHLSTGIFGTKMLFDVLAENDNKEMAYRVADQRSFPGWGYMLEQGATTLWETWAFSDNVYSQNHPMFGSIR